MVIGESNSDMTITEGEEMILDISSCILSVEADYDVVRYALFDESSSAAILFKTCESQKEIRDDAYLKSSNDFHKVFIAQSCANYALFPLNIKEEINAAIYSSSDFIPSIDASLTYNEDSLTSHVKSMFPGAFLRHGMSSFLEGVLKRTKFLKGVRIYADVKEQLVHIVVVANGKLLSSVSERIDDSKDVIYHILARIEAYKLNQLEDVICLSGNVLASGVVYTSLMKHMKDVQINKGFNYQKLMSGSSEVNKQEFFTVINSFQCG
ncbi:MAG: DUF3822 family protein [Flavobacteriales bacterium]|jgi:hypothetical protein|tara:strand:- start:1694 stop:2491 length:798 start_codon:yes stop_codon:yes gene_type:complete